MENNNLRGKTFTSKSSTIINAPIAKVWDALVNPKIAKKYFMGAEVITDWEVGNPILFKGEFNGNKYEEKGILLKVDPEIQLQYSHWSHFDGLPDVPENYRTWAFSLSTKEDGILLSVSEDNIPTEKQRNRSEEFWTEVLATIKKILEKNEIHP